MCSGDDTWARQGTEGISVQMQVDDLVLFANLIRKEYTTQMPMFLGGHSMGSLASIHAALRDQAAWDGLVLGTATVDVEWNWVLR